VVEQGCELPGAFLHELMTRSGEHLEPGIGQEPGNPPSGEPNGGRMQGVAGQVHPVFTWDN